MLEIIKNWALTITVAVLIGALLEMLLPQSNIKKYAKAAIAIMIMLVIITPLAGIFKGEIKLGKEFDSIFNQAEQQLKTYKENSLGLYKDYVYEVYMRNKTNKNE